MFFAFAIALVTGCHGASVPLLSPLIMESEEFPIRTVSSSPIPARLMAQVSSNSPSSDASPGPTDTTERGQHWSTINIHALDQVSQKHLIEKQKCNLLIIQDQHHYTKLNCNQKGGVEAVAFYFTAIDKAFACCLDFQMMIENPEEFNKNWYLIPFMRSLTDATDQIPYADERLQLRNVLKAQRPSSKSERVHQQSWNYMAKATMGDLSADNLIPEHLCHHIRWIVFKIWRSVSKYLFKMKADEFLSLINHPMFAHLRSNIPSSIFATIQFMEKDFNQLNVDPNDPKARRPSLKGSKLIREWHSFTQFKGDLEALKRIHIWLQGKANGHLVLNLLPRYGQAGDEFAHVRTGLLKMGFQESNIDIAHDEKHV